MRLIDADALMMYLADIALSNSPNDTDDLQQRNERQAYLQQIRFAESIIEGAPTADGRRLLKEKEPRIMSVEEATNDEAFTAVWLEKKTGELVNGLYVRKSINNTKKQAAVFMIHDSPNYRGIFSITNYMLTWRCWDERPSEDQRKAVEWGH